MPKWREPDLNRRHHGFQPCALPTELPRRGSGQSSRGLASLACRGDESRRTQRRPVAVIGAGLDLGAGRRGVDMGPSAIRYAGLQERIASLGRECVDWGDVDVSLPEATEVGDPRARYLEPIKRSCERVAALVEEARRERLRAARARRRPLGRDRARSAGWRSVHGAGRRAVDRRARRPQPARDVAERQRARDAARRRARRGRATRSRATPGRRRRSSGRRSSASARSTRRSVN